MKAMILRQSRRVSTGQERESMQEIFESIADLLKTRLEGDPKIRAEVIAVYLFGSYATGLAQESSDIDLAFLLDEKRYRLDAFESSSGAHLVAAHMALLLDAEIDVTVLNGASMEMAYEVVTTGICLYDADSDRRFGYEAKVRGMYFDFKPFLDSLRKQYVDGL